MLCLLDLTLEAGSTVQSCNINAVNVRRLVFPHNEEQQHLAGLVSTEEPHYSDFRRVNEGEALEGKIIAPVSNGKLPEHLGIGTERLLVLRTTSPPF